MRDAVGNPEDWSFSWQLRDDVTLTSTCDFCGRTALRLTYEVTRDTQALWVCQSCVSRYPIGAMLDGEPMLPKAARAYAHGLTARLKQQTCQDILRHVQSALPDAVLEEILVYFDRNLQLSPQRAARLFSAMAQVGEATNARIFEVQTRSNAHQQEFGELDDGDRRLVWTVLSPQQRRRLASLGFAPAGTLVHRSQGRRSPRVEIELAAPRMPALTGVATLGSALKIY
ncbi:hypothetical protein [Devosia sp. A449]